MTKMSSVLRGKRFVHQWMIILASVLVVQGCVKVHPVGVANTSIIPNHHMTASTSTAYYTPKYGRLGSEKAWCASANGSKDWLQIDMGQAYLMCGVATQGSDYLVSQWTTNYTLSMSRDGVAWQPYLENGVKYFKGNHNDTSVVRHDLPSPIWARYVKFYIENFNVAPCLRVEIFVQFTSPVIAQYPQLLKVPLGGSFRLDCLAKGSPLPTITWKLNGNDFTGRTLKNGSIVVDHSERFHEGRYLCTARNKLGSDINQVNVSIYEKPKILSSSPRNKAFVLRSTAVLSCYATGDPQPSITWLKNGLTPIPRATLHDNNRVLVITNVSSRDQGVYKCVARNDFGQISSSSYVKIIDHPEIDMALTRKIVKTRINQPVNIGCYGNSILPLKYTWSKNKVALNSNHGYKYIKVYGNILVVTPRQKADYGMFTCHVSNVVGSTHINIDLQTFIKNNKHIGDIQPCLSHNASCSHKLGTIIPLILVFSLSVAINIRLVYHTYQIKKLFKTLPSKPISMTTLSHKESNLSKDPETAWDNLLPETSGQQGGFDNAGIITDNDSFFKQRIHSKT